MPDETTFICDSCGFEYPIAAAVDVMDEAMETWRVCKCCNTPAE